MIPALATIVFAYCTARLLLLCGEMRQEAGSWWEAFRVMVVGAAILVMAWSWWAIQQKGLEVADLSRSLGLSP